MDYSRREVLEILGIAALAASTCPVMNAFAASGHGSSDPKPSIKTDPHELKAKQWAMVIDTRKIHSSRELEPIIEACHKLHNVPQFEKKNHEIKWIWEEEYKHAFPSDAARFVDDRVKHTPFLVLCNHCENPPCVRACPTKATFKRETDGIVMMDFHRCIGCRFCMAACPYGARSFNFRDPRPFIKETNKEFPTRMKGVVEKCQFCTELLAVGKMPACVEASNGILTFGDLYDEHSDVRKLLKENFTIRRKQNLGTEPSVYYIV
jgi:molybdopterin-containing oxidoreductase family iron-sulfur binding subunit